LAETFFDMIYIVTGFCK